jgi:predicted TIM-barrel fold metal-dependent hydrolase
MVNPMARRNDPARGEAAATATENVRECMVAMPESVRDLAARAAARRARGAPAVVWVCPGPDGHGYPLEPWAISPIPEFCEREDLALIVDYGETRDYPWAGMVSFARAYPRLPIVALGAPLVGPAAARALDATPNLIFDTSGLESASDIAALTALARGRGAYRFVYGSGDCAVTATEIGAALAESDSAEIFGNNAARLDKGTWGSEFL